MNILKLVECKGAFALPYFSYFLKILAIGSTVSVDHVELIVHIVPTGNG